MSDLGQARRLRRRRAAVPARAFFAISSAARWAAAVPAAPATATRAISSFDTCVCTRADAAEMLLAATFITDNKKGLLKMCAREAAGSASSTDAYKSTTKWLGKYDATSVFIKVNKKGPGWRACGWLLPHGGYLQARSSVQ